MLLEDAQKTAGYLNLPNSQAWVPAFLLADNGFAHTKTVMQPYRKTQLTSENHLFNEQLSASRVKIENLFGILTSKFKIFRRDLNLDPENSRALIIAACVIHNITVGPLPLIDDDDIEPPAEDPYLTPECLRSALKHYLLYQ
uniref:DDE Tnp4 domain-containing protein n=1 Tax=Caenorhabditis japonica TaxID=281687 RepID=A0A2Q4T569_CAEJA